MNRCLTTLISLLLGVWLPCAAIGQSAGKSLEHITLFSVPTPLTDQVWLAKEKGYYAQEGIDLTIRDFGSGGALLEAFRGGAGDVAFAGDFTALVHWSATGGGVRMLAAMTRDNNEAAVAKTSIRGPDDLKGKIIATRVGTTGSYFIARYLAKSGLKESEVTIKNLDPDACIAALDRGEIDAFFLFQPFPFRSLEISGNKVHILTNSKGYHNNYGVLLARPDWISKNKALLERFMRATIKGSDLAQRNPGETERLFNQRYGLSVKAVQATLNGLERPVGFDERVYDDFAEMARWLRSTGQMQREFVLEDFVYLDAVRAVAPKRATPIPGK